MSTDAAEQPDAEDPRPVEVARPVIGQSAPAGAVVPMPATSGPTPASPERPQGAGVTVGKIVEVTVSAVADDEVEVRLADGRTGVIPRREFDGGVAVGDDIHAALLARDDPRRRAVLSVAWARKQEAWERVEAALAEGTPLRGTVTKLVKGGAVVDVGLRGFLPASLVGDGAGKDASALVGTEVEVLVTEVDRPSDRIVVSIRDLQRRRRRAAEKELLRSLEPGARASGRVVSIAEYGAVVDLGGARGLIHRSELTWGRLESIESIVSVGDEVEVVVLDVNRSKRRIGLSLRATQPDPYSAVEVGAIESATVVRVVDYGVFARIDSNGAEGLVHISELSDVPGYRPDQLVTPGEQVMVKVLDIDRKRRRLALSVRRVLIDD
jgi:small subunit ribosomal protein S1